MYLPFGKEVARVFVHAVQRALRMYCTQDGMPSATGVVATVELGGALTELSIQQLQRRRKRPALCLAVCALLYAVKEEPVCTAYLGVLLGERRPDRPFQFVYREQCTMTKNVDWCSFHPTLQKVSS